MFEDRHRFTILGTPFDLIDYETVLAGVEGLRTQRAPAYIVISNPHSVMNARRDPRFDPIRSRGCAGVSGWCADNIGCTTPAISASVPGRLSELDDEVM